MTCPTNNDYAHVVIDPDAERPGLGIHKLSTSNQSKLTRSHMQGYIVSNNRQSHAAFDFTVVNWIRKTNGSSSGFCK